jgi:hypothetical protein
MKCIITILMITIFLTQRLYSVQPDTVPTAHYLRTPKSEAVAVGLSLGATVIPIALVYGTVHDENSYWSLLPAITGLVIGPSIGHFYAEQWGHGFKTVGVRLGICVLGYTGMTLDRRSNANFWDAFHNELLVGTIAAGALIGHALWDIAQAEKSAYKYNESIKIQIQPDINLKEKRYGIGFVYRF